MVDHYSQGIAYDVNSALIYTQFTDETDSPVGWDLGIWDTNTWDET